ncbi:MAG: succinate dehydrogenase flavoprotein subunit [Proteobacteria bacterium]|nr:succinate dehydrogenase flavoprotein subunit [Pseudomonadota bacterium]
MSSGCEVIVVGGGLAGLMATIVACENNLRVKLFTLLPAKRSHSVCAQGGINASVNTKGEGDSPEIHFYETVYGGDFLANQPPVKAMCENAPNIVYLLDRMGVMFNRTPEGFLDFRRFGGTQYHRTAFAGATTGQQILYALDEQVRRFESSGLVKKYTGWEFLRAVIDDDNICRGIVAGNIHTQEIEYFKADAVVIATGGLGMIFGKSTNSVICTGSAQSILYKQGVKYANGEFIQVHPTAIAGGDKLRLISESVRGEGGRIWTYKDGKPWYFLEEKYPKYGNLVPRDIASREIFNVCVNMGLGIDGKNQVYLDVTHIDRQTLEYKLGGVLEIYEKFMGEDPYTKPMKVFPAVHYTMGGLWVDYNQMTNIPGLFAAGECEYQYHGANRLGANSLLSCIHGGMVVGKKIPEYLKGLDKSCADIGENLFEREKKSVLSKFERYKSLKGKENPYHLHKELGELMTENVTVIRYNDKLKMTIEKIKELKERFNKIDILDNSDFGNQTLFYVNQLANMLDLALVITKGALLRNESRGSHYKPEFPQRDDENFLKTTIAIYDEKNDEPVISYEEVDTSLIKPVTRKYD